MTRKMTDLSFFQSQSSSLAQNTKIGLSENIFPTRWLRSLGLCWNVNSLLHTKRRRSKRSARNWTNWQRCTAPRWCRWRNGRRRWRRSVRRRRSLEPRWFHWRKCSFYHKRAGQTNIFQFLSGCQLLDWLITCSRTLLGTMMEVPPPDNFLDMGKEEGRWKTRQAEPGGVEEWGGIGIFSSKMPGWEGGVVFTSQTTWSHGLADIVQGLCPCTSFWPSGEWKWRRGSLVEERTSLSLLYPM